MATLNIPVYSREGKKVGEMEISRAVFGIKPNPSILHEALIAQQANARRSIADTKMRGEVRGGGKKPWKQKGTGRARHGSSRSPIWVGGGITFGPSSSRNFSLKINKKTKKLAVCMSLSDKVAEGKIVILDEFAQPEFKTKTVATMLASMPVKGKRTLIVLPARDQKLLMSARNIEGVFTTNAASLSLEDILTAGMVLTTKDGVAAIEKNLATAKR